MLIKIENHNILLGVQSYGVGVANPLLVYTRFIDSTPITLCDKSYVPYSTTYGVLRGLSDIIC